LRSAIKRIRALSGFHLLEGLDYIVALGFGESGQCRLLGLKP